MAWGQRLASRISLVETNGPMLILPNIFWLMLYLGAFLGIYIIFGAVFAGILVAPPYNFPYSSVGFVFGGQIVVAFLAVPLFGWGSDFTLKWMSRRNYGVTEPEHRLIGAIIPFICIIVATVIFGQAGSHPSGWSWAAIAVPFNVEYFGFVGMVISSFTYVIDNYPQRTDASLVVLCAGRGFISFGVSFGAVAFIDKKGYDGAMNICAIIVGPLAALGFVVYFTRKSIRRFTQRWAVDQE